MLNVDAKHEDLNKKLKQVHLLSLKQKKMKMIEENEDLRLANGEELIPEEGPEESGSTDSSVLSEFADDKQRADRVKALQYMNLEDEEKKIDPATLKPGEFVSQGGRKVRPVRNDSGQLKKRAQVGEDEAQRMRQREMLKQKIENSDIIRDVLKNQMI